MADIDGSIAPPPAEPGRPDPGPSPDPTPAEPDPGTPDEPIVPLDSDELLPNGDALRDVNQDVDPADQHDDASAQDDGAGSSGNTRL